MYPQDLSGYGYRDSPYTLPWWDTAGFGEPCGEWDPLFTSLVQNAEEWGVDSKASPEREAAVVACAPPVQAGAATRRKRRRTKIVKNKEEIKSQRMTHIAVERNRRRQMNQYLAVLRSLMPPSYAQRGDQASIVGGAINYVRELEQLVQSLEVQKSQKEHSSSAEGVQSPFAGFFTFPQYSTSAAASHGGNVDNARKIKAETTTPAPAIADIEVSMVESHANLKVQAPQRPRQLLKLVAGLQQLGLTTLHLNMTTVDAMVMYSFSLKVEDECKLGSLDEIAAAVHEILGRIQEEAGFS